MALMLGLLFVFVLGQLVPQRALMSRAQYEALLGLAPAIMEPLDYIGVFRIYTSPLVAVLLGLFFANLLLVMYSRLGVVRCRCALLDMAKPFDSLTLRIDRAGPDALEIPLSDQLPEGKLESVIKTALRGYRVFSCNGKHIGVKNRFGPLGSVLFHLSFILLLAGGLMVFYTRSYGEVYLTEGQEFYGSRDEYARLIRSKTGAMPKVAFAVKKISQSVKGDVITSAWADIRMQGQGLDSLDNSGRPGRTVAINRPVYVGDTAILLNAYGVAPLISLRDASGAVYEYAYVNLNVFPMGLDTVEFPATDITARLEFFPDYYSDMGIDASRSIEIRNPVFSVELLKGGKVTASGLLRVGGKLGAGGFEFSIEDMRLWGKFQVIRERGGGFLYAGFLAGFAGLLWRFFLYRREVRIHAGEGRILISGWSEYFLQGQMHHEARRVAGLIREQLEGRAHDAY